MKKKRFDTATDVEMNVWVWLVNTHNALCVVSTL